MYLTIQCYTAEDINLQIVPSVNLLLGREFSQPVGDEIQAAAPYATCWQTGKSECNSRQIQRQRPLSSSRCPV
jgi:hypothetical protein